jgi:hypothetical protein
MYSEAQRFPGLKATLALPEVLIMAFAAKDLYGFTSKLLSGILSGF